MTNLELKKNLKSRAAEKGHTDTAELCEYMKSENFLKSVREYVSLMESTTV